MWFRRKEKNRRADRIEVLDVRMRAVPTKKSRMRLFRLGLAVGLVAVFSAYGTMALLRWFRIHPVLDKEAFALNTIEVQTDGWVLAEQVRQWAGLRLGDDTLALDLTRIRRDLELVPQIESVAVERVLPHLLRLRVSERDPIAQVQALQPLSDGSVIAAVFYLDPDGVVMPPLQAGQQSPAMTQALRSLPIIRGLNSAELRAGQSVSQPSARAALKFLSEFELSPMASLLDIKSIEVTQPEVLVVTTGQGNDITFGQGNFETQLRRWQMVYDAGMKRGQMVASLDLSVSNNNPVLWQEASAVSTFKPRPTRVLHNHKRNV